LKPAAVSIETVPDLELMSH